MGSSVEHDLSVYEREQDRLDAEGAALDARAQPIFIEIMKNQLDSDVLSAAFAELTLEEYQSLEEDLGHGPMRDISHAGSIMSNALERYVMQLAMDEAAG